MISSFVMALAFFVAGRVGHHVAEHVASIVTVAVTTVVWATTTLLTRPTERAQLLAFYRRVRPAGPGWRSVRAEAGVEPSPDSIPQMLLGWMLGWLFVYAALFGAGAFLFGRVALGTVWTTVFVVTGVWLLRLLPRMWSGEDVREPNRSGS